MKGVHFEIGNKSLPEKLSTMHGDTYQKPNIKNFGSIHDGSVAWVQRHNFRALG